ncbi:hypothetical protein B1R32_11088 [Abditibacterium utsteinense]|uniref:Uncharacterized protein n=1 Tax=Abditibacterium utsteinense TaxID=1960156 RepID=A0A2S8SS32_9BACT|nr:hypothetical protein [Abditibacterium utsteinense]PQV63622.1 hypothetical protein B1R32_11088 [Abditibacterium utsteinense]
MLHNVAAFEQKYRRDFAPGSNAAKRFDDNTTFLIKIEDLVATHNAALGDFPDEILGKEIDVSTLRTQLRTIVETGQRVFGAEPEKAKKLRIPKKDTVSQLILDARAMRQIAFIHQSAFVAKKMPADFLAQLDSTIAEVWSALRAEQGDLTAQSATTPNLNAILKSALANVRLLDAPIQTKFSANPAVVEEWESASQVDYGQSASELPAAPTESE